MGQNNTFCFSKNENIVRNFFFFMEELKIWKWKSSGPTYLLTNLWSAPKRLKWFRDFRKVDITGFLCDIHVFFLSFEQFDD